MLRTTSKKACENIKAYIMDNFDASNYAGFDNFEDTAPETWPEIAAFIWQVFCAEKPLRYRSCGKIFTVFPDEATFKDWTQGLPSVLDCCYWWYNRSAVDDVAKILEETSEETSKYGEIEVGELLTHLMYRELSKEIRRQRSMGNVG